MNKFLLLSFIASLLFFQACKKADDPADALNPSVPFVANDVVIGSNFIQVEFSDDSRSMVWAEQTGTSGVAKVYYADVDLNTGLPDLNNKQFVDNIQNQGWPYWGSDSQGAFFVLMNSSKEIKIVRRNGTNTLVVTNLGTVNSDVKSLINVSHDPSKPYCWINYVVKTSLVGGKDKLYCFRSDNPSNRVFVNEELPNSSGSAYELTFPRWLKNSETLLYPFRGNAALPLFDIKFWDGKTQQSTQATNDGAAFHHVDDLAFSIGNQGYLFSSKNTNRLVISKLQPSGFYTESENYSTPTTIANFTLTSFEPFSVKGVTFGAYQVYEGGGIPGNSVGEIWLKGILGESLQIKISTLNGVTVDPEFVIGKNKVWIYYYGKPIGQSFYDLHRCETPLSF